MSEKNVAAQNKIRELLQINHDYLISKKFNLKDDGSYIYTSQENSIFLLTYSSYNPHSLFFNQGRFQFFKLENPNEIHLRLEREEFKSMKIHIEAILEVESAFETGLKTLK